MLKQYQIELIPTEGALVPSSAYQLYGWMMERVSKELGFKLHQQERTPISQYLFRENREKSAWRWSVAALDQECVEFLDGLFNQLGEIDLSNNHLKAKLTATKCFDPAEALRAQPYEESRKMNIHFLSPTGFKQNGAYVLYPQSDLIIKSLVSKWNAAFPDMPFDDDDALNMLTHEVNIASYRLNSTVYKMKAQKIRAFTGRVTLYSRLAAPLQLLYHALLSFAPYSGLGIKTALGMGGVLVEKPDLSGLFKGNRV